MKILAMFLLILVAISTSLGSPLIFKSNQNIDSQEKYLDSPPIDVSKFKKIRVVVKRNSEYKFENHKFDNFRVMTVENDDSVVIGGEFINESSTAVIDVPSDKIKISIKAKGNFTIYIYGQ